MSTMESNVPAPSDSLESVREYLNENFDAGTNCPACHQTVRLYKRSLTMAHVRALKQLAQWGGYHKAIHVYEMDRKQQTHVTQTNFQLMAYWGLISQAGPRDLDTGNTSGYWNVEKKGIDFIQGNAQIPKYVHIFNRTKYRQSEMMVNVKDIQADFEFYKLIDAEPFITDDNFFDSNYYWQDK